MVKNNELNISQDELLFVLSNKVKPITTEPFGVVYSIHDFIEGLMLGIFNGYDGYGVFASRNYMLDTGEAINLSRIKKSLPKGATHVVWIEA